MNIHFVNYIKHFNLIVKEPHIYCGSQAINKLTNTIVMSPITQTPHISLHTVPPETHRYHQQQQHKPQVTKPHNFLFKEIFQSN